MASSRVGDPIQPSHPLPPSSPVGFNLPQHQGLFQWVGYLHQVAKVLELQLQHQSFQRIFRVYFLLGLTGLSPSGSRNSQESSPIPQFKNIQLSHPSWLLEKPYLWLCRPLSLLFNMLSRFVIAFLPRRKCLLILWLQSPSAVILEPPK